MPELTLKPTPEDTFRIVYGGNAGFSFERALEHSRDQEREGDIEGACNTRFEAAQRLIDLVPEESETVLEWDDRHNQHALFVLHSSAIDHFLVGDFEMCAAMLELLLELDPEDHMEATMVLAYAYIALEEYELFDEVLYDISDKDADKTILKLWSEFRRTGRLAAGEMLHFRKNFRDFHAEFIREDHPVSDDYLRDVESERPSRESLARELWLQTEHLWTLFPDFIAALKNAK